MNMRDGERGSRSSAEARCAVLCHLELFEWGIVYDTLISFSGFEGVCGEC